MKPTEKPTIPSEPSEEDYDASQEFPTIRSLTRRGEEDIERFKKGVKEEGICRLTIREIKNLVRRELSS